MLKYNNKIKQNTSKDNDWIMTGRLCWFCFQSVFPFSWKYLVHLFLSIICVLHQKNIEQGLVLQAVISMFSRPKFTSARLSFPHLDVIYLSSSCQQFPN